MSSLERVSGHQRSFSPLAQRRAGAKCTQRAQTRHTSTVARWERRRQKGGGESCRLKQLALLLSSNSGARSVCVQCINGDGCSLLGLISGGALAERLNPAECSDLLQSDLRGVQRVQTYSRPWQAHLQAWLRRANTAEWALERAR